MHTWVFSLLAGVGLLVLPAWGQQRPLRTDDAALVGVGRVRTEFGLEFLQGQRYPLSGLEGDLTRVGVVSIHVGVGEYAEFQISGVLQDFLSVSGRTAPVLRPNFAGNATSDFGDLVLATKLRLAPENKLRPALAFKFAAQLPNASNESGLGTDEMGFFADVLLSKSIGRAQILGNLGLAILGSPVQPNSQSDMLTYGLGAILPVHSKVNLVGEVYARRGPGYVGNEDRGQVRLGIQIRGAGLRWDIAGIAGLRQYDADSGLALGVTYEFQAFHKKQAPKIVK